MAGIKEPKAINRFDYGVGLVEILHRIWAILLLVGDCHHQDVVFVDGELVEEEVVFGAQFLDEYPLLEGGDEGIFI
jgi:hypothetical protein